MSIPHTDLSARTAYEAFAASYDAFNHIYQYKQWTARLLEEARTRGLAGNRLLDVACGTGFSFIPMLERGWQVTACDISPAMLDIARAKVGDDAELLVADMRDLPPLGKFDLIWSLNDSVNYLLTVEELRGALGSMRRNLAPGGVLLFDLNTLQTYKTFFSQTQTRELGDERFIWHGLMNPDAIEPGSVCEARFEAAGRAADHVHRQRHFPEPEVLASIADAGIRCLAVLGERNGDLEPGVEESVHTKAVYICTADGPGTAE